MFEFLPTTLNLSPAGSFSPREHIVYATARFSRASGMARGNWVDVGSMVVYASMTSSRPGPPAQIKLAFRPSLTKPAISQYSGSNRGDLALLRGQRNKTGGEHCVGEFTHLQALAACIQYVECNVCAAAHSQARYVLYLCDVPAARRGAQNHAHRNSHRQHSESPVELLFHKVSYLKIFYSLSAARQAQPGTA